MPTNGAFRIDIYYSKKLDQYRVIPRQYRTDNLLSDTAMARGVTEVLSPYVVHKRDGYGQFHCCFSKTFKSKRRALKYAEKSGKKADKFLYKQFTGDNWQRMNVSVPSAEKKWTLDFDEAAHLETALKDEPEYF